MAAPTEEQLSVPYRAPKFRIYRRRRVQKARLGSKRSLRLRLARLLRRIRLRWLVAQYQKALEGTKAVCLGIATGMIKVAASREVQYGLMSEAYISAPITVTRNPATISDKGP